MCFSEPESVYIRSCMKVLWNTVVDMPDQFNMTHLLTYLSDLHRERLERILATCLLYCSRYQDTRVIMIKQQPQCRMMIINLDNIPGSDPPIGQTPDGEPCSSLAILYHWSCPRSRAPFFSIHYLND